MIPAHPFDRIPEGRLRWFVLPVSGLGFLLLVGLGVNALFGWWWADPVAALAMLPLVIREGWEALAEAREGAGESGTEAHDLEV